MPYISALKNKLVNSSKLLVSLLIVLFLLFATFFYLWISGKALNYQVRFERYLCEKEIIDQCSTVNVHSEVQRNKPEVTGSPSPPEIVTQNMVFLQVGEDEIIVLSGTENITYPLARNVQFGLSFEYQPGSEKENIINEIATTHSITFKKGIDHDEDRFRDQDVAYAFPVHEDIFRSVAERGKVVNLLFDSEIKYVTGVILLEP